MLLITCSSGNLILPLLPHSDTLLQIPCWQSGWMEAKVIASNRVIAKKAVMVQSDQQPAALELYISPKSTIAGHPEQCFLASVLSDKYGNPLENGQEINYQLEYPNQQVKTVTGKPQFGMFFTPITQILQAGKIMCFASYHSLQAEPATVRIFSGKPASIHIYCVSQTPIADGNSTLIIRTDIIRDDYGNTVADGAYITFLAEADGAKTYLSSYTLSGIATVSFQNPVKAGHFTITAFSDNGVQSNALTFYFSKIPVP